MILNKTTNQIISETELYCQSFFSQVIGLMLKKKQSLIMEFKEPKTVFLHTWFVFYSIDIFFLNKHQEVIEMYRNFKPFTIYPAKNKAKFLIETPELNREVKIGDKITW